MAAPAKPNEGFVAAMQRRYAPTIALSSSLDCDAIVRTATANAHPTARDLLSHTLSALQASSDDPLHCQLVPASEAPALTSHANRHVQAAFARARSLRALLPAFESVLEDCTAVSRHSFVRDPPLALHAAWVAQPALALPVPTPDHPPDLNLHLLLFVRPASRHDAAALPAAREAAARSLAPDRVHVLHLASDLATTQRSVAAVLLLLLRDAATRLSKNTDDLLTSSEKARRALRSSSFRAWFSTAPPPNPSPLIMVPEGLPQVTPVSTSVSAAVTTTGPPAPAARSASYTIPSSTSSSKSASTSTTPSTSTSTSSSAVRRNSFSAAYHTPQLDPASVEGQLRRFADYAFVTRRYAEAADAYTQLTADFRSMTGLAAVHEASAHEMLALSRAMVGAPPIAVLPSLERAVDAYLSAYRVELAVRTLLRAARYVDAFHVDAGQELNAPARLLAMLIRTRDGLLIPQAATSLTVTGSFFVDVALTILPILSALRPVVARPRRRSLYAFIATIRLSNLGYYTLASDAASLVDHAAAAHIAPVALHIGVVDAIAAALQASHSRSRALFSHLLAAVTPGTDVELQSDVVRSFIKYVAQAPRPDRPATERWDATVAFPVVRADAAPGEARVETIDMRHVINSDDAWRILEDDVLEDWDWLRRVHDKHNQQQKQQQHDQQQQHKHSVHRASTPLLKRERRVESVVAELRAADAKPGAGSVETKIERLLDTARQRRSNVRVRALVARGSVINEPITLHATMENPLQFPVFVDDLRAVVQLNETVLTPGTSTDDAGPVQFDACSGLALKPCERRTVSVSVTCSVPGTLTFIGLTWAFTIGMGASASTSAAAPTVRGFCTLHKRGRRLNDTRRQRAADPPQYAPDDSLTVRVVPAQSRLLASLSLPPSSTVPRPGQLRRASLTLSNDSDVSHDSPIFVRAPALLVDAHPVDLPASSGPAAFGPADDGAPPFIAAAYNVNVPARSTKTLFVWLRGTSARVAIAYGDPLHPRLARAALVPPTHPPSTSPRPVPALTAAARFVRRAAPAALLGVELELAHAGRDRVTLTHLSACAPGWTLCPLPSPDSALPSPPVSLRDLAQGAPRAPEPLRAPAAATLLTNETATLFALLTPSTSASLSPSAETTKSPPVCVDSARLPSDPHPPPHDTEKDKDNDKDNDNDIEDALARAHAHFLRLAALSGPVLSVRWSAADGATGDIHVPLSTVDLVAASAPRSPLHPPAEPPRLRVVLRHASEVRHVFVQSRASVPVLVPAVVPVDVSLTNDGPVTLDVRLATSSTSRPVWAGDVSVAAEALPPGATRHAQLTAVLAASGQFNLAALAVTAGPVGGPAVTVPIDPSYVCVVPETQAEQKALAEKKAQAEVETQLNNKAELPQEDRNVVHDEPHCNGKSHKDNAADDRHESVVEIESTAGGGRENFSS